MSHSQVTGLRMIMMACRHISVITKWWWRWWLWRWWQWCQRLWWWWGGGGGWQGREEKPRWAINKEERAGIFREAESNQSSNETNIPISQTYSLISLRYIWNLDNFGSMLSWDGKNTPTSCTSSHNELYASIRNKFVLFNSSNLLGFDDYPSLTLYYRL